jgi:bifunctional non-homologous end joining protein LigD
MTIPRASGPPRPVRPFDDPHWLFELKHEGIRSLAIVRHGEVRFLSQTGRWLAGFPLLAAALRRQLTVDEAILDGAIAAPNDAGRTTLSRLMRRPADARFYAFDLLWLNGQDTRAVPLLARKERLRDLVSRRVDRLVFVEHVRQYGTVLHRLACRRAFPGIIAKRADIAYDKVSMQSGWIEIENPRYEPSAGQGAWESHARRGRGSRRRR